jgi:hypothetical protein
VYESATKLAPTASKFVEKRLIAPQSVSFPNKLKATQANVLNSPKSAPKRTVLRNLEQSYISILQTGSARIFASARTPLHRS